MKRFHHRHWRLRGVATSGQWACILRRGAFLSTIKTPHRTTSDTDTPLCSIFLDQRHQSAYRSVFSINESSVENDGRGDVWWIGMPPTFLILCLGDRSTEVWLSISELKPVRVNRDERFINLPSEFWMGHANFILEIRNPWRGRGNRSGGVEAVEERRPFLPSSVRMYPIPLPEIYQEGVIYALVHSYCDYT